MFTHFHGYQNFLEYLIVLPKISNRCAVDKIFVDRSLQRREKILTMRCLLPFFGSSFFGEISNNGCRPPVTAVVSWWSANDWRMPSSADPHGRRTESIAICERRTASGNEFQSVMVRGNNEYFKASVRTGYDINLFSLEALVCRDETEKCVVWSYLSSNCKCQDGFITPRSMASVTDTYGKSLLLNLGL